MEWLRSSLPELDLTEAEKGEVGVTGMDSRGRLGHLPVKGTRDMVW